MPKDSHVFLGWTNPTGDFRLPELGEQETKENDSFFPFSIKKPRSLRGPPLIRKQTKESQFYDKSGSMAVLH